ncbi:uncharacterized protein B0I36DRAFT_252377 [Microdochium trichocladiopsis]|uniref:Glycoside hydrolase family 125 protein n=1 Tax=Microdochium trichocladiopsis TaxID=1682393 RepID=A0A9P8XVZ5_9PEZI|nr:uncharacterized protein B0I36DRAFT_252377 [Microdochium trichocladiopsis]KAH7020947.1 hypothetical protein B0I36DRAFT_252377 [Microdochium trichocladiopsis]
MLQSLGLCALAGAQSCPEYIDYSKERHEPFSSGRYQLSYQRPPPECRKFVLPEVEQAIVDMKTTIADPDLFRLFENAFPNTLDTTISWHGYAAGSDEELTFITTGDIVASWLRDSANQLRSYKSLLVANDSHDSLASLYRGAINLQGRYIRTSPFCNAFQAPIESGLPPEFNDWVDKDTVKPAYDRNFVFECKYELDSLAAFLQLSFDYYDKTKDAAFFGKYQWLATVEKILNVTNSLLVGSYNEDGSLVELPYTFQRETTSASETLSNDGTSAPIRSGTGLVRSAFRPSDDSAIYQLLIPSNMQFSSYLDKCAAIAASCASPLAGEMREMASGVRAGIDKYAKVSHDEFGEIYAFEVDGYGSRNMMDDANVPSLLSAPLLGYVDVADETYQNTRKFVLSKMNPYYNWGPAFSGIGGPHQGPGQAWPMSVITSLLTSDDDEEIRLGLRSIVSTTDGLGLVHESINTFNVSDWTRQWFSWANGLFGEMLLDLNERKPHLLSESYQ